MVISGKGGEEREAEKLMAMGPERSKPLHNFKMPDLRWGNQRFLRCIKVNPDGEALSAAAVDRRFSALGVEKGSIVRRREPEHDRWLWIERRESFEKAPAAGAGGFRVKSQAESDGDDGIEAVREKLMFDLQAAADKMKDAILRGRTEEEEPPPPPLAEAEPDRPWNLRTRRAACKAPNGGSGGAGGTVNGGMLKVDDRKPHFSPLRTENKSPRLRRDVADVPTGQKRERLKFSVSLSRREIEMDFTELTGHRPPRRPKKRPKIVQKQLDSLFPGLWLTEITPDIYKVPDGPETGK
ncbi:Delphilin like, partial [Actinidia chinensis var. chinensis]